LTAHAERVESELLASERALRGRDARLDGELTLTAGDGVMRYLIIPWLLELRRSQPNLRLQLRSDNRPLDLARREADVALRLVRPREASLVATRVAHFPFAVYASRAYLARRGSPRRIADLAAEDWLGWDDELAGTEQSRWLAKRFPGARLCLRINTTSGLIAACALGHGLAVLPTFAAEHELSLVRVAARSQPPARDLWLVTHSDSRRNARVRVLRSWLSERFARSWPPAAPG
jgi:DNA-binding transcriptional LysR family regulator